MGKRRKKNSKKYGRKLDDISREQDPEQDFDTLFETDTVGKLTKKRKKLLRNHEARKKIKRVDFTQEVLIKKMEIRLKQHQKKNKKKIVDIWDMDVEELPKSKHENTAPQPTHIIEGNIPVPSSGSSYNPSEEARSKAVHSILKDIEKHELRRVKDLDQDLRPNIQSLVKTKPKTKTELTERIAELQTHTQHRAVEITLNGEDAAALFLQENGDDLDYSSDEESSEAGTKINYRQKPTNEKKTRRVINRARNKRRNEVQHKRKVRQKEYRKHLQQLDTFITDAKKLPAASPPKPKKVELHPRLGPKRYEEQPSDVSLTEELTDSLRTVQPVGNLVADLYSNVQRRNKLEVRKRVSDRKRRQYPKWKVQTRVGEGKDSMPVANRYIY